LQSFNAAFCKENSKDTPWNRFRIFQNLWLYQKNGVYKPVAQSILHRQKPNSRGIGFTAFGIDDSSFLKVDERMRLQAPGPYAVGDVNGISLLDSTAFSQASVAINSILGVQSRFDRRWTPRCVHTEPMVAAVGWTQQEAQAQGVEYLAVCDTIHLVSDSERSLVEPEPTFLKVIVDPHNWHLLGCLVVGDHASTIANSAASGIESGLSVKNLREIPLTQPSAMEALMAMLRKLDEGTPWCSV
jgi:dihydrolipoamide dehydrogenase